MIPFSILDLAPIVEGSDAAQAFRNSLDLAQRAESWGYRRYWLAEHHNMTGIASAATSVVIGHIAAGTSHIRVGAGGIMLPNHSPLVIAEQFGTLASLYPGRIDLGLGRAPGTDLRTARALRRDLASNANNFPRDVLELQSLFGPVEPGQAIRAVPGAGLEVPLWILGSSLFGARVAATMGLPFAFASHFAPDALLQALEVYRNEFKPSAQLKRPYVMAAAGLYAADNDTEARRIFTSAQQQFTNLLRGLPGPVQPPMDTMDDYWSPREKAEVEHMLQYAMVGSPETVRRKLESFVDLTGLDELVLTSQIYEHRARLRAFEIAADLCASLRPSASG
ncbi:MAG TPA: LLM class flavin-dependent oxidoreductase [Gammaproteobacteria bacterium]|nr:LLM class flavin-dependent oxidoreductase [Gammaproteobacteria bacterium]